VESTDIGMIRWVPAFEPVKELAFSMTIGGQ
jgi:hypothetical protein